MKTAEIEVDLPMLINHCGKLRMLSHRFVMMLSLCQQGVPRKAEYFAAAQEALKGLKTTARYFVNPEAVRDNLDHAALYLKRGDVLDPEAIAILSRFIMENNVPAGFSFASPALFPAIAFDVLCWIGQICAASTPISIM